MTEFDQIMRDYEQLKKARAELLAINKQTVFAALTAAGITSIHVEFDGSGDSGQTEAPVAFNGKDGVDIPAQTVTMRVLPHGAPEPLIAETQLAEAIDDLCYGYLQAKHDGWETDEGAFGEFEFDVAAGLIRLRYEQRFIDSITHNHEF